MKVSYNWLQTYLTIKETPEELAEILTDTGLEIEKVEKFESIPGALRGVVVGEVLDVWPHPNADKLQLTKVNLGNEEVQIVCGAPNVAKGQKVFVATVGTTLIPEPEKPFEIKKAKIRGEESFGMICSEMELGIGTGHEGIMVLPPKTKVGVSAAEFLKIETDYMLEIGLTPNRTDAFSHYGVARDVAARYSLNQPVKAKLPELKTQNPNENSTPKITIEIRDKQGCGRYAAILIENIKVQPSPAWLQNKLQTVGQSPINNIVDITNFVQQETGQPLHAFDADKIAGQKVIVDTLPQETEFTTLDGVERKLHADDLMICDEEGGMCIAGVYGGAHSGVTDKTQSVLIESAYFNPTRIRKTAKRHGLNTDASFRFERGVDPQGVLYALKRAADLVLEMAGGEIVGPVIDIITEIPKPVELDFNLDRFNKLSGTSVDANTVEGILKSLDIEILENSNSTYRLKIPTYRVDVTREVDVIEEVLRIYGYNRVEIPEQMRISVTAEKKPSRHQIIRSIGELLVGRGFHEMMSNGLTRSDYIKDVAGDAWNEKMVYILNPLSQELDVLRPNLIISALESVAYNLNHQAERLKLFEIGKAYFKTKSGYGETTKMLLALTGLRFRESWSNTDQDVDVSDLKGHIQTVFQRMGLEVEFKTQVNSNPFYQNVLSIFLNNTEIGIAGNVSKKAMKRYSLKQDTLIAEFDLDACLGRIRHADKVFTALPKFPSVRRDLSLLLDHHIRFEEIEKIAFANGGSLMKEVDLFDVYEGKNLPAGKKSYAVSFILQDESKTLKDKQIDKIMNTIQAELETSLGASLR